MVSKKLEYKYCIDFCGSAASMQASLASAAKTLCGLVCILSRCARVDNCG